MVLILMPAVGCWMQMIDRSAQTPKGLLVQPQRVHELKRKLKAVRSALKRMRVRRDRAEQKARNGENVEI